MKERTVTVGLSDGLDAGVIATLACRFESKVDLQADGKKVNGKSIMGMMNMGVSKGGEITILTEGPDEDMALDELEAVLAGK